MLLTLGQKYIFALFIAAPLLTGISTPSFAASLHQYIEAPEIVGKARLKFMFWNVYEASLIAHKGNFTQEQPFALELKYLRGFEGKEIASRSIDEMRSLGMDDEVKLAKWYQEMQGIFPNVKEGEMITGVVDDKQISHFFFNDKPLGIVHDKEFSKWFFNIWLSEKTSQPEMREQLLGLTH